MSGARIWTASDRTGGVLDSVLDDLRDRYPNLVVERLVGTYPADDDDVYWLSLRPAPQLRGAETIQVDTHPSGGAPLLLEGERDRGEWLETSDSGLAVSRLTEWLDRRAAAGGSPTGRPAPGSGPWRVVRCRLVRWVSNEPQPGWVEARLLDVNHRSWVFFDKPPIFFGGEDARDDTRYPIDGGIRCEVVAHRFPPDGREVVRISTAYDGVESEDGVDQFDIWPDQLLPGEFTSGTTR